MKIWLSMAIAIAVSVGSVAQADIIQVETRSHSSGKKITLNSRNKVSVAGQVAARHGVNQWLYSNGVPLIAPTEANIKVKSKRIAIHRTVIETAWGPTINEHGDPVFQDYHFVRIYIR